MGRPRKNVDEGSTVGELQGELLAQVESGEYPRDDMPGLLAIAKQNNDKPLIAAILKACAQ